MATYWAGWLAGWLALHYSCSTEPGSQPANQPASQPTNRLHASCNTIVAQSQPTSQPIACLMQCNCSTEPTNQPAHCVPHTIHKPAASHLCERNSASNQVQCAGCLSIEWNQAMVRSHNFISIVCVGQAMLAHGQEAWQTRDRRTSANV